jgi:hypothetical protein
MNYRHAFHAGNHADVFKHLTLTRLIALMSRKEQPFAYLDTTPASVCMTCRAIRPIVPASTWKASRVCGSSRICRR